MATPATTIGVMLRRAEAADIPSICTLGASTFSTTFGHSLLPKDLTAYLESAYSTQAIAAELANPAMTTTVAADPTQPAHILGFAQLIRHSSTAEPSLLGVEKPIEMHRLYVDPQFHGQKVGASLMGEMERIARNEGFKTMWLGVWEENYVARKFYDRWGFVRVGEHPFIMGDCTQVDWILSKRL
ncbi:hypothetical protein K3495_g4057 [Podosphaera aphanis]|nr:hypothetical protein K3495_g4057 [Podosphaera aphanis]